MFSKKSTNATRQTCYTLCDMKPDLPNIFEYNDFRRFLSDYQEHRARQDKSFNKSNLCKKLGIPNSRSYVKDVINGKKVTSTYIERFVRALELDRDEAQFFRVLVKLDQAENADEHELYFSQIISLNRTPKRVLDKKVYAFYKDWRHSAVRAVLDIVDFNGDYRKLASNLMPPITPKQARVSIALLKALGLISQDEKGFFKPTDKVITTPDWEKNELVKQYQAQLLDLARNAVIKQKRLPQRITTNLLTISGKGYERLQAKIAQFKAEVRSLVNKDESPADRVYLYAMLLVPVGMKQTKEKA
jgi:uncharacterized protein (TIGR02147 family)